MSYGRTTTQQKIDPAVFEGLLQAAVLNVPAEEREALRTAFQNQLAAFDVLRRIPALATTPVFKMDARWNE
jgi:hypothetical protein